MFDVILCFAVICFLISLYQKYRKMPPGPFGLPLVGYYPFLGKDPIDAIHRLSERYGEMMSINLLGENYWILSSVEAIEEAFITKGDEFAGKSKTEYNMQLLFAKNSFVMSEGDEWKSQVKFIHGNLSQLGMGKTHYEATLHDLLDYVESYILSKNGEPQNFEEILSNYSVNSATTILCSKQYKIEDEDYIRLMVATKKYFSSLEYMNTTLTGNVFKCLTKLRPRMEKEVNEAYSIYIDYSRKLVEERMKTFDEKNCSDLLDYWIKESKEPNQRHFKYELIADNIAAMILGSHSPTTFLFDCLCRLAEMPEIQEKVFQEISDTIGVDRDFCYLDKDQTPYTQAVMAEVHRLNSPLAVGLNHWARVSTKLRGYDVPKGQKVLPNICSLALNPKYFKNPNEFDPNNFLDEHGLYKPNKALIPFGVGARKCIGMKLAEVEIYLAFVRFVRKFRWIKADSTLSTIGDVRFFRTFQMSAQLRQ